MQTTESHHGPAGPRPWRTALRRCGKMMGGLLLLLAGVAAELPAQQASTRVAIILDRTTPQEEARVAVFQRELKAFFRTGEVTFLPPQAADGSLTGVRRLLEQAIQDSTVTIVVALGPIGSHLLAHVLHPTKPAIAAMVVDAGWQDLPARNGTSGVANLTYVDEGFALGGSLADFHRLVPYRHLAILMDPALMRAIPALEANARTLVAALGADAAMVPVGDSVDAVLASLPAGTDAVFLTVFPDLPETELRQLIAGLTARRLPTLSHLAETVPLGALASYEPPEQWQRRARRVAVDLQRILAGDDAGTLPVRLLTAPRLLLNLATARAIGVTPGYSVLTEAELVGEAGGAGADSLTLASAMRVAAVSNLDVRAADLGVESGEEGVRRVRAGLLPRVESQIGGTVTREAVAAAGLGRQPERTLTGGLTLSAPLYAEEAWAGFGAARQLQVATAARRDERRLDVVTAVAEAYITVLQARTLAKVRRSNLYRSRTNLETARVRAGVGSTSRADLYRWQGEVANARRDLIAAESQVRTATLGLERLLNLPLDQPLAPRAVELADPALLAQDSTVLGWLENPARVAVLARFLVEEALRAAPELARADAAIAAVTRQRTAAGRAYWLPTFSLQGGLDNVFSQGGAGSSAPRLPGGLTLGTVPDLRWQLRLQASLPLFTGFERDARRAQASADLAALRVERANAAQAVEQRVRASVETAASSYAAIALAREAAEAAGRNYELVTDSYARGTASITTLIDAQNAAQVSAEAAANAVHDFLLDLVRVERAVGAFTALRTAPDQQAFLDRLHALKEQP